MGSYRFEQKKEKVTPAGWRGIGCLLMIILPVVSYFGAEALLKVSSIRAIFASAMPGLFGRIGIHPLLRRVTSLTPVWTWLYSIEDLGVNLVLGIVILVILSGIISVLYGVMYGAVRPSKYGPTDAPPPKRSKKSKKSYSR